jgi:hypothetical protein
MLDAYYDGRDQNQIGPRHILAQSTSRQQSQNSMIMSYSYLQDMEFIIPLLFFFSINSIG